MRIEPAPSLPWCSGPKPAAAAAPAPADEAPALVAVLPRIVRDAGQRRVADAGPAEFRRRGLAEDDRALVAQARHDGRVLGGLIAGEDVAAHLRRHVLGDRQVLDGDGNAVQPADTLVPASAPLPRASRPSIAASAARWANALTRGFSASMRASSAVISSTGESCFCRIISASCTAGVKASVSLSIPVSLFSRSRGRRRCRTRRRWRSCIPRSPASRPARRSRRSRRSGRAGSSTA